MNWLEKLQSLWVVVAIAIGLGLGQVEWIAERAVYWVVPCLMVMLYGVFFHLPRQQLQVAWRSYKVTALSLGMNFLWTPLFAWGLGAIFLQDAPDLWVGLIMLMVTPCTDWYLVFTSIARGNVALANALLPWNLVLQIVLLPIYLLIFAGTLVHIDVAILLESVVLVLVVPWLLASISRWWMRQGKGWGQRVLLRIAAAQGLFLGLSIAAMFASQGQILVQRPELLLKMLIPVLVFFGVNFWLGQAIGSWARLSYEEMACLNCTTLARNSPISLAIATSAFPDRPLISLALVIGPLIELPVMVLISQVLLVLRRRVDMPG